MSQYLHGERHQGDVEIIASVTGDLQETGKTIMKNIGCLSEDIERPVVMGQNGIYKRE